MLISWVDLSVFIVWGFFLGMFFSITNLFNMLLMSELIWIFMYVYASFLATYYDSLFIFLVALYLFAISTGETTIGLSLLILRMAIFGSINASDILGLKNYFLGKREKKSLINSKKK